MLSWLRSPTGNLSPSRAALALWVTPFLYILLGPTCQLGLANQDDKEEFKPDLTVAQEHFTHGRYAEARKHSQLAVEKSIWNEKWYLLDIQILLLQGEYDQAKKTLELGLRKYSSSLQLRWLGRDVYRHLNQPETADELLDTMARLANASPWRYSDRMNRILVGRILLEQGADPRRVIDLFFDQVKQRYPDTIEAYLAVADLALAKRDFKLAADELQLALQRDEENPEILWRLATAFLPSDNSLANEYLNRCLEINPNCLPAHWIVVDQALAGEDRDTVTSQLELIESLNPHHPRLWSYRAVLAHLDHDLDAEQAHRKQALACWNTNPEVDHTIGRELSEKYRFREGAEYQRKALEFNADYLPAKVQLTQDLLRLGDEQSGWELLQEVRQQDRFNVVAFNLETLAQRLEEFHVIEDDGLIIKMDAREAQLYGDELLTLLKTARNELSTKYQLELPQPILVEVFSEQSDFAIRTFGLPGGDGFLGVCFGTVITMNGPQAQTQPLTSWESVLWHEFCHVVTLTKTRHRMPRWLSEGLSVYEERQRDSGWGQWMNPTYQEWLLGDECVPVSQLSDAFLRPKSPQHLNFAYYEASLVVEYLIESQGFDAVLGLLDDLGAGLKLEEALTRRWGPPDAIDEAFAMYARSRAEAFAPAWTWQPPPDTDLDNLTPEELNELQQSEPNNLPVRMAEIRRLVDQQKLAEADQRFQQLQKELPTQRLGWRQSWAQILQTLEDQDREIEILESVINQQADAEPQLLRLLELYEVRKRWADVQRIARRLQGVNPLLQEIYQAQGNAALASDNTDTAINSLQKQLAFPQSNPGLLRYQLAQLWAKKQAWDQAHHQIVLAIEAAPRNRAAYQLFDEIQSNRNVTNQDDSPPQQNALEKPDSPGGKR